MDLILSIRQMMADENFSGAEQALETAFVTAQSEQRNQLIQLYLECLLQQKKSLPDHLVAELINVIWNQDQQLAVTFFENAQESLRSSQDSRVLSFRMKLAEKRGHIKELHDLISQFNMRLYERNLPAVPQVVKELVHKYFRTDFQLRLQGLALSLLRKDHQDAEAQIRHLILEAYERSNPKLLRQKLVSLLDVLATQTEKGPLEIYQSLLHVLVNGFVDKKDFKRLAEAVIYLDDFRFHVMIMSLLLSHGHESIAVEYSQEIVTHENYDFVYIAKHFPELKKYFVNITESVKRADSWESPDIELTEEPGRDFYLAQPFDPSEDEVLLTQLVRNQEFSDVSLLDLAVSFLQSELPRVAVAAAMTVHERTKEPGMRLKAAYLALTAHLLSGDYRKALDLALESMKLVTTTDDLLSFLYCEAEAYIRLNQKNEAKQVLQKIISIDSHYRMARERLEKL